jgi:DNA helicase II / ATP-dependent DNA helicase PcrA
VIAQAVEAGRLRIVAPVESDKATATVASEIERLHSEGFEDIGVFVHTNEAVEQLCAGLAAAGVAHAPVGLSEAYSQALAAQQTITEAAAGQADWGDILRALAVYLTALTKGKKAPPAAHRLAVGQLPSANQQRRLDSLQNEIDQLEAGDLSAAATLAADAWPRLAFDRGDREWRRAALVTRAAIAATNSLPADARRDRLSEEIRLLRGSTLLDKDEASTHAVQVMNLHQTKGRETDATILLCREDDWMGYETEPYEKGSRLLYVVLTRASEQAVVLLPSRPHGLFAPLLTLHR